MENSQNTPRSYALALLTLMGDQEGANGENPPLGIALRWETQSSVYNLHAHRLLKALIDHPPNPEGNQVVVQEFMTELTKCENSVVIDLGDALSTSSDTFYVDYYVQVNSLNTDSSVDPANWAAAVYEGLSHSGGRVPLKNLAEKYLNTLVIPSTAQCNICLLH